MMIAAGPSPTIRWWLRCARLRVWIIEGNKADSTTRSNTDTHSRSNFQKKRTVSIDLENEPTP
jgi:hypothetical protein